jgi:3-oxoacyl-[acyl-carrier-protein] synthase-3
MIFNHVAIEGLAIIEAPHRITSAQIEHRIGLHGEEIGIRPGLIKMLTGVVARRFWDEGVMPSEVATMAAEKVLAETGIPRDKIGVIINTSVCRDYLEPSVASIVHGRLELATHCLNFDVSNACLAFLNGMVIASNMIERGQIDYALIVDGEGSRRVIESTIARLQKSNSTSQDLRDDFATLTLGSGAAAMILCRDDMATTTHRFRGGVSLAASEWNHLCRGDEERMVTDASQLLKAGVALARQTWSLATDVLAWRQDDLDELILHQVGSIHMRTLLEELQLPEQRAFVTYSEYGNIGPAAIPFTLAKSRDAGRVFEGDRIALMGIGSGLNCAMMEIIW